MAVVAVVQTVTVIGAGSIRSAAGKYSICSNGVQGVHMALPALAFSCYHLATCQKSAFARYQRTEAGQATQLQ